MGDWKRHQKYKDLEGSRDGSVRRVSGKPLNIDTSNGYARFNITYKDPDTGEKSRDQVYVHRFICDLFKPRPAWDKDEELKIDHIDNNPLNNSVDNLQWLSNSANIKKAGEKLNTAHKRNTPVFVKDLETNTGRRFESSKAVKTEHCVSDSTVCRALKKKKNGGFNWFRSKREDIKGRKFEVCWIEE